MINQFFKDMRAIYDSVGGDREAFKAELKRLKKEGEEHLSLSDIDDPIADIHDVDTYIRMNMMDDVTAEDVATIWCYLDDQLPESEIDPLWMRMFDNDKLYDAFKFLEMKIMLETGRPPKVRQSK